MDRRGAAAFTPDEIATAIVMHESGATQRVIADALGRSQRGVGIVLERSGTATRRRGPARRYALDESFFDVIDTEAKAYWLGFITADGRVTEPRQPAVVVNLGIRDVDHLERLRSDVATTSPVRVLAHNGAKGGPAVRLLLSSAHLVRALNALGLDHRKTWTATPWQGPPELMRHYWRGLFDGDGCIHITHNSASMSLIATEPVALAFRQWVMERVPTTARIQRAPSPHMRVFSISGSRVCRSLAEALYGHSSVGLARKIALARQVIERPDPIWPRKVDWEKVCELYSSGLTQREVADAVGCEQTTVSQILRKLDQPRRDHHIRHRDSAGRFY